MSFSEKVIQNENYLVFLIIPVFWLFLLSTVSSDFSYWTRYLWMFPVAIVISITVNTVGISGAALFVPFFVIIFPIFAPPLSPIQSVKLGLITESFGLSSSALAFMRYGMVDKKLGLYTILGAAPFVIGGVYFSVIIPKFLSYFLIALALLLSVYLLKHKERSKSKKDCIKGEVIGSHHEHHDMNVTLVDRDGKEYRYCRCNYRRRFINYGIGGIFQGMAGFGIGELGIVSMLKTKIPIRVAIGTSHIIVASTAILASIAHISGSLNSGIETPWNILFMTVPAVITGGQIAPYIAAKLKASVLENFVSGLFIVLAMALLWLGANAI